MKRRIADLETLDVASIVSRQDPRVTSLETAITSTLAAIFGEGTDEFYRYYSATRLDDGPYSAMPDWIDARSGARHDEAADARRYVAEGKAQAIALLSQAVQDLEEEIEFEVPAVAFTSSEPALAPSRKIFVVHGHDEAAKEALARFLEKLELEAIVLHEQPDQGRTIIEKFEDCAREVGFAVVLLTPDDLGSAKTDSVPNARARQNVIFELGYFSGKLGRGKTCLLQKGEVEIPSDLFGVIYTELDSGEGWKMKLVREMKAAGLPFNPNKLWE